MNVLKSFSFIEFNFLINSVLQQAVFSVVAFTLFTNVIWTYFGIIFCYQF